MWRWTARAAAGGGACLRRSAGRARAQPDRVPDPGAELLNDVCVASPDVCVLCRAVGALGLALPAAPVLISNGSGFMDARWISSF